jgi:hypothetical protein
MHDEEPVVTLARRPARALAAVPASPPDAADDTTFVREAAAHGESAAPPDCATLFRVLHRLRGI